MVSIKKKSALILATCLIILVIAIPAYAEPTGSGTYNRTNAVSYAELYALNPNPNYVHYLSDCTNFVSQCLKYGGWPYANTNLPATNVYAWWYKTSPVSNSHAWSVADRLYGFTYCWSNPYRGGPVSPDTYSGTTSVAYPSGVQAGDLFFYDWETDGTMNHVSIYVVDGTDPNGDHYTGALIDQHTTNRYHAIWSLSSYNVNKYTTQIRPIHLYSSF